MAAQLQPSAYQAFEIARADQRLYGTKVADETVGEHGELGKHLGVAGGIATTTKS